MIEIPMPRLSDSMEEGTILRWIAPEGAMLKRGDELAEIETDKASMVYEADADGLLHRVAGEGDTLPVGALIAQLLQEGEQVPDGGAASAAAPAPQTEPTTRSPQAEPAAQPPQQAEPEAQTQAPPEPASDVWNSGERVKSSPLARRLAGEAGLELSRIQGSGPGGRVIKADVERALQTQSQPTAPPARPPAPEGARPPAPPAAPGPQGARVVRGESETVELSRTQALIARRMAEAKATIPEFTLQCDIDMEAAVAAREQLKAIAQARSIAAPSFNDLIVKACALALREHPRANGTYKDGTFELHGRVNVGVAVAAADALVVPVIRDADALSLWEIAAESRRLAGAVRDGTITPPELAGGTFSVSNLGMYGIDAFTAVINPPQAAILAVGSLSQRAVVYEGELSARHTMTVTLSCDHRILYGADAAEFLGRVKELLQRPLSLLV